MDCRRVAIAEEQAVDRAALRARLEQLGRQVVVDARNGDDLLSGCRRNAPGLIVADLRLAAADGASAAVRAAAELRVPLAALSTEAEAVAVAAAPPDGVFAWLTKPLRIGDLAAALAVAERRHREMAALADELASVRQLLADRKIIERAKGLLMRRARIDEPEAFARLRLAARQHRQKMVDVARSILVAEGTLDDDLPGRTGSAP